MAGRKRASNETGATTRAAKAAKTGEGDVKTKAHSKAGKKGAKASLAPSVFKAKALPLHLNITHTPPVIPDENSVPAASADPGFIGSATLVPSVFSTGSYGWKGSKRVTIDLPNPEGGEAEKVHVLITMNATVMGSKQAKETDEEDHKDEEHDENAEETAEEKNGTHDDDEYAEDAAGDAVEES